MDQNNQNPTPPEQNPAPAAPTPAPQTTPPASVPPAAPQAPAQAPADPPSSAAPGGNKRTMILIGVVIVMAVAVGLIYIFAVKSATNVATTSSIKTPPKVIPLPTAQPTPTLTPEKEVNGMDTGDPQQDVNTVTQDANQL